MFSYINFGTKKAIAALAVVSGGVLVGVWVMEYGFGFLPCRLCLWQRVPYEVVMVLGGLSVLVSRWWAGLLAHRGKLFGLLGGIFLCGVGLGGYHVGVETGWWSFSCGGAGMPEGLEALQGAVAPVVPCDAPAARFLGVSLAGWNVLMSLGLASLSFFWAWKR